LIAGACGDVASAGKVSARHLPGVHPPAPILRLPRYPVEQGITMASVLAPRLQRIAPYFVIGWLSGVLILARPTSEVRAPSDAMRTRPAEFYEPPLHPVTVALGQALFSVLGLAVLSRRRLKSPAGIDESQIFDEC
jgi:hypothetical protein